MILHIYFASLTIKAEGCKSTQLFTKALFPCCTRASFMPARNTLAAFAFISNCILNASLNHLPTYLNICYHKGF